MPALARLPSVDGMASRPGKGWRIAVVAGCVAPAVALAGCSPSSSSPSSISSSSSNDPNASTPAATAAATSPAVATGVSGDYCSTVIKVNNDAGTMRGKTFVPTDQWSRAQVAILVDWTLGHRTEFLNITPPELKQAVEAEIQWMQAIKAAGYDLAAQGPAGTADAMGKITNYQLTQCGISYG